MAGAVKVADELTVVSASRTTHLRVRRSKVQQAMVESRVVLVTGGASGIGRGMVERFLEEGDQVAVADINLAAAQAVADDLGGSEGGARTIGVELDVRSEASVSDAFDRIVDRWGRLDVVLSNAGIYPASVIEDLTAEAWDEVQQVNLRGSFFCLKHAARHMRPNGFGRIVVTSSVTGPITGFPGWAHYGASKAGQLGMIRSAAIELAKTGITVNAVLPGNVRAPAWDDLPAEYAESTARAIPIGRLATPSDIAQAASFFADRRSGYVTGQTLVVDGGQILPEVPLVE